MSRFALRCRAPVVCLCLALVGGCGGVIPGGPKPLTLIWYGIARQGTFQNPTYVPLDDSVTLATGDGVQMFLSVKPAAYVYVLHQRMSGEFAVWWPTEAEGFNAHLEEGYVRTLPSRGRVYSMELARGTEAIYIVASRRPIETVDELTREMRWLFASAQAIGAKVPTERIREGMPRNLKWTLDARRPEPVQLVDQHIPVGTTVHSIGRRLTGGNQFVTTADGRTYSVHAEVLRGQDVVARIVRLRRTISR